MSPDSTERDTSPDWGAVALAFVLVLGGLSAIGAIAYADTTTTMRADYEDYSRNCDALAGQTRLVDGGLGMQSETLNETHVQACKNTSFAEYRQARYESLRTTPVNPTQWAMYGGFAGSISAVGGYILFRQFRAGEAS